MPDRFNHGMNYGDLSHSTSIDAPANMPAAVTNYVDSTGLRGAANPGR